MAEEHRLTAAEVLQYFLSRYKVDDGSGEAEDMSDASSQATPLAATVAPDEDRAGE
ncbi:hypothetical protein SVA_2364 [Sulfurifustis variabilis]|uniref:Uncharacterized protein n=1 Tax=Sulfurifustis variabilis TaxID=1675686 RepID=A0A1B4VAS7_9GAMM|nr:hypothetical protein [Sulfurifustis variabilis]BAU48914.1 hypothetical protein SVA_2364 [Sulfurifustis variabilis]